MLIFDSFSSRDRATAFAESVRRQLEVTAHVCDTQEEVQRHDAFPFELAVPAVVVERTFDAVEELAEVLVENFGGRYAGT